MGREACKPRCGIAIKSKGHFREIVFAPKYDVPKKSIITHNNFRDMAFKGTSIELRGVFVVFWRSNGEKGEKYECMRSSRMEKIVLCSTN